jgi:hypothetical protein
MPMQAESLDVLEKAAVPPAQARAIVRAIEIELVGAKDTLATKHDLLLLRQEFHQQFHQEFGNLRQEMTELRASLEGQMAKLRLDMEGQVATLCSEMGAMGSELRAEIQTAISGSTRQMYMALLGQTAVMLGFAYFFATHIA